MVNEIDTGMFVVRTERRQDGVGLAVVIGDRYYAAIVDKELDTEEAVGRAFFSIGRHLLGGVE